MVDIVCIFFYVFILNLDTIFPEFVPRCLIENKSPLVKI